MVNKEQISRYFNIRKIVDEYSKLERNLYVVISNYRDYDLRI